MLERERGEHDREWDDKRPTSMASATDAPVLGMEGLPNPDLLYCFDIQRWRWWGGTWTTITFACTIATPLDWT